MSEGYLPAKYRYPLSVTCNSNMLRGNLNRKYTYFIKAKESGRIKIGSSDKPIVRFKLLCGSSPEPLELLGITEDVCESTLHIKFQEYLHHNEWFVPEIEPYLRTYYS